MVKHKKPQSLYQDVENFVVDSFTKSGDVKGIPHFKRTVYWLKKLKPAADEAMLIAAIAHDIDRAFRAGTIRLIIQFDKGFKDDFFLIDHPKKGAEITGNFLEKQGADEELISRVKMLVSKHEVGGNRDQNLIKDADSISFFENNAEHFATKLTRDISRAKVKEKLDWMFERITFQDAKKLAEPWYKKAINKLER